MDLGLESKHSTKHWTAQVQISSHQCKPVTHLKLDSVVVALGPESFVGVVDIGLVLVAPNDRLHFTPDLHQMLGVPEIDLQQ